MNLKLKNYLLNNLPENERQEVESRLLGDDEFYENLGLEEENLIEAYLENELTPEERKAFEKYFLAHPSRQADFRLIKNLKKIGTEKRLKVETESPEPLKAKKEKRPKFDWHKLFPVYVPVAVLVLIACSVALWWNVAPDSQANKGLALLKEAFRTERPLEARLTEFDYAPFIRTRGAAEKNESVELKLAENNLLEAVKNKPNTQSYYALGKFYLATRQFDKAIFQFKKSLETAGENAKTHAELGAAYLEFGTKFKESDDKLNSALNFAAALKELNKALELDKSLLEPLFNRAFVYQNLGLPEKAEDDWKTYLEKDSTSRWADEARQQLKILEEKKSKTALSDETIFENFKAAYIEKNKQKAWEAVKLSRSRQGIAVAEKLIDDFLSQPPNPENKENLQMLKFAGEVQKEIVGDFFLSDLAEFYAKANPAELELSRKAREAMSRGKSVYFKGQWETAIKYFSEASKLFLESKNEPEALFAESFIGYCILRIPKPKEGLQIFKSLFENYGIKKYGSMQAQSLIGISDAESNSNEPSKAIEAAEKAFLLAAEFEDFDTKVRALQVIILTRTDFGQYRDSLVKIAEFITLEETFPIKTNVIWSVKSSLPEVFYGLGLLDAAIAFQEQNTKLAGETGQPLLKSRSLEKTAKFYAEVGKIAESQKYLDAAMLPEEIGKDEKFRQNITASVSLTAAGIYRRNGNFEKAFEYYLTAQKIYETEIDLTNELYRIYGGKVLCYIGLQNFEAARAEMQKASAELEVLRKNIKSESDRNQFFDIQQNYYDVAVGLAISQPGGALEALEYSEKNRARSLLQRLNAEAAPLSVQELQKRLSEKAQVVEFAVLEDRIIAWIITKNDIKFTETPLKASELTKKISRYADLIIRADDAEKDESDKLAGELYRLLISPTEPWLNAEKTLFIVPDKDLNFLPFASLIKPETGKYLIENYEVGISPSLNLFVLSSAKAKEKATLKTKRILSVGNPKFDREKFADLENLPSAEREAEKIASFYESSTLLLREDATKESVGANLNKFEIVHLALHAVTDAQNPQQSGFVLSKTENSDGMFRAAEIYTNLKFGNTKLVVLSACETGIEQALRGEGAISLARPFLAGGVPLVVASLWKVDSEATAELMINFHRNRKQKQLNSLEAMRQARIEMLNSQNPAFRHPKAWSSFIEIGGETDF